MTRAFKRAVCRMLIGVVLLAQMAVTAYACPGMSMATSASGDTADASMVSMMNMPDQQANSAPATPDQPDMGAPSLCSAHCHLGQQNVDHSPALDIPVPALASLYAVPLLTATVVPVRPAAAEPDRLAAASPPHAILHCCFRI